jgi:3D (Asp-Asp-Asp) domain-containing protein
MQNDTLSEKQLKKGPLWLRAIIRNAIVLCCSLGAMQMVVMNSKEVIDSKLDGRYLQYKTAALSHIKFPSFEFLATAYSHDGITKSGLPVMTGLIAADPSILPLGSLVRVDSTSYRGLYQVMDTGRLIKGKRIDIFMPDIDSALVFGAQKVNLTVLRYGYLWLGAHQAAISIMNPAFSAPANN